MPSVISGRENHENKTFFAFYNNLFRNGFLSLVVTRDPSVITRGPSVVHPWSLVVIRCHSWSLVCMYF
jgi:hypothetical protein